MELNSAGRGKGTTMEVTEVRIRLVSDNSAEKLCAFATITLDNEFVVRDMKVIEGNNGLFIAMPSRKVMERCRKCGSKNAVRSSFCNDCGTKLPPSRVDVDGRGKAHVDVAHPVTSGCRERIHAAVVNAYEKARERGHADAGDDHDDGKGWQIFR